MARTWLQVEVELLGGRGEDLWPPPGRTFAVGPTHTFGRLGEAIDVAFARWDLGHLRSFLLADGTVVTDPETADELADSPGGPLAGPSAAIDDARVSRHVGVGDEFCYVFDFGDDWTHRCTVVGKIDPVEALGAAPRRPTAYFGWGAIPDQYGRRWAEDDGEGEPPAAPLRTHPMLTGDWPGVERAPFVDARELRGAVARGDVATIVAAVRGREVDDALQLVGSAWLRVLAAGDESADSVAVSLVNRLSLRGAPGDEVLAEDLLAALRGTPVAARHLVVDLSELAGELDGPEEEPAGVLDLTTGEVLPHFLTDPVEAEDALVDTESEPDRWLWLERLGSREGWQDMAAFASGVGATSVREKLERAIEGRGAFRRFRDVVDEEGLVDGWRRFSDDRAMGRARQYLADRGIRVDPR